MSEIHQTMLNSANDDRSVPTLMTRTTGPSDRHVKAERSPSPRGTLVYPALANAVCVHLAAVDSHKLRGIPLRQVSAIPSPAPPQASRSKGRPPSAWTSSGRRSGAGGHTAIARPSIGPSAPLQRGAVQRLTTLSWAAPPSELVVSEDSGQAAIRLCRPRQLRGSQ